MFNKQNVKEFRSDFQQAVEKLEEQYGCNISLGTISFDGSELRSKIIQRRFPESSCSIRRAVWCKYFIRYYQV